MSAYNKAIFKRINGKLCLLCSECGEVIKTEKDFDATEIYAVKGATTLLSVYCDDHKLLGLYGKDKKEEERRKRIKQKLREGIVRKNLLTIEITRPNQELKIMRGIPGSGKSTEANKIVGEGVIHSTDNIIEAMGDYNGYFRKMIEANDWSEHGRTHRKNFVNAKASMEAGISPVVIDNTNIKPKEARNYVEAALKLGLDEANITIIDVASGGCTPEVLAERNTHNVPLKVINRMIQSHASVGELTVAKILNYKGSVQLTNESNYNDGDTTRVLYNGVMIDDTSKSKLLSIELAKKKLSEGWKSFAHHMTISFGKPLEDRGVIGKYVNLTATDIGESDMAIAVKVNGYPSDNDIPHITIAVNVSEGGKPFMSNKITNWSPLGSPISLYGVVQEVTT
jgi:predicted kinase